MMMHSVAGEEGSTAVVVAGAADYVVAGSAAAVVAAGVGFPSTLTTFLLRFAAVF